MRKGFSLLTAIVFLILVATISTLALVLSTQSAKQTTDIFLKAQAELLLRSGTEYAMLAMSGTNYNVTCLNNVNIRYPVADGNYTHDINISIQYLLTNNPGGVCNVFNGAPNIDTNESNRTVIIDTVVQTNPNLTTEPIRMHRRTIQKP
ncbi:hypothetical protein [Sulfurospirillum arcachonense]|uniref:hypothetical protein n=1 Tax=Sulfurospirillum arcachonense TaxID=57666 RepID=UPI000469D2B7|nr:hypothetical protein [Sulfurospirillum arcachonense]